MHFSLGLVGILATTPLLLQAAPTPDQDVGESPNNKFGNPDGPAWVLGRPPNKFPAKPGDGPAWTLGRPPNKFPADPGDGPTWTLGRPPNKFNNNGGGGLRPDPQPFQGESAIYHPPKKPVVGIGRTFYNGKRVENGHPAGTSYDFMVCNKGCTGDGLCTRPGSKNTRFTGDKVKKVVVVPGTQCIVVFPGAPNKLKECAHGDKEERCRPLNVGQTSKQQPISTKGLGQSWFGKCFWPDHQDHTEPIEQRTLICNKGGSTFANDWDESRHWIRAGNAHWKDRGQPGWKDHGPFGN